MRTPKLLLACVPSNSFCISHQAALHIHSCASTAHSPTHTQNKKSAMLHSSQSTADYIATITSTNNQIWLKETLQIAVTFERIYCIQIDSFCFIRIHHILESEFDASLALHVVQTLYQSGVNFWKFKTSTVSTIRIL